MSKVEFPNESSGRNWSLCAHKGCTGEAAPDYQLCVLHMPDAMRAEYLAAVGAEHKRLTLAGLTVSGRLFAAILAAMPTTPDNASGQPRPYIPVDAFFDETVFTDHVDAQHVSFGKSCSMPKAVFQNGVTWNGTRFGALLDLRKARILGSDATFSHATVAGEARCMGLESEQMLNLFGVRFGQNLDLRYCNLNGIWLSNAYIAGDLNAAYGSFVNIPEAHACSTARLDAVSVAGRLDFSNAKLAHETTFGGYADMTPAQLQGHISFRDCTFGDPEHEGRYLLQRLYFSDAVDFSGCTFYGRVSFSQSVFGSRLVLNDVKVDDSYPHTQDQNLEIFPEIALDLRQVSFEHGALIARVSVTGSMEMECRLFQGDFDIEGLEATQTIRISQTSVGYFPAEISAAEALAFTRCQFNSGGTITCQTSSLSFTECDARQPLTVASMIGKEPAKLISFFGTNLENFVLSGIDMSAAIFTGAIGLDHLTIEGAPRFFRSPSLLGNGRQTVQDEVILRSAHSKRWKKLVANTNGEITRTDYHRAAAVYRTLRKSREDNKDEPGAADFYYGEMEMRRMAAPMFSAERWLLTAYWLCSGYALRAWRAFAALLITLTVASFLLHQFGYAADAVSSVSRSALLLTQITVVIPALPNTLTPVGTLIVIVARLLLATFLALAVLALRGRVKR